LILAIVQARMGSSRLPGKVMREVLGKPLIGHLLDRLKLSEAIDRIVVATSKEKNDDKLFEYVKSLGFNTYRGKKDDVLDRFYQVAKQYNPDAIVRITGDCPLIDYKVVDKIVTYYQNNDFDYVSNTNPPTYPDGLDTEVFSYDALKRAWQEAKLRYEREHVTQYIINSGKFKLGNVRAEKNYSGERWVVDYEEDFVFIKNIIENLSKRLKYFDMYDILQYKKENPEIFEINKYIKRNIGLQKSLEEERIKKQDG